MTDEAKVKIHEALEKVAKSHKWYYLENDVREAVSLALELLASEDKPQADKIDLADSCYEAAHSMPRSEALRFIASQVASQVASNCVKLTQAEVSGELDDLISAIQSVEPGSGGCNDMDHDEAKEKIIAFFAARPAPTAEKRDIEREGWEKAVAWWKDRAEKAEAAEKALREAARLAFKLFARAEKDAKGCPFDCHDEDCETCLPQRTKKALRAAIQRCEPREEPR